MAGAELRADLPRLEERCQPLRLGAVQFDPAFSQVQDLVHSDHEARKRDDLGDSRLHVVERVRDRSFQYTTLCATNHAHPELASR